MSAFVPHAGVAENTGALKALALDKARCVNAALYIGRAFRRRAVFKLLVLQRRSLDDDINAVEQRPGDAAVICAHLVCRAAAAPDGWPYHPHLQGFIAHTSMKFAGKVSVPATRETVTSPSSRG